MSEAWDGEEEVEFWASIFRVFMHPAATVLRDDGMPEEAFVALAREAFKEMPDTTVLNSIASLRHDMHR